MVLVQKWPSFVLFFLGNMGKENVFYDILKRKNAFLGYKNKKFKISKYFLRKIDKKNSFYGILEPKNASLSHENKKFKKSKNFPWFWSKNGHFSYLFF